MGRVLQGLDDMSSWAASDCPGYLPFLESLQSQLEQLRLFRPSPTKSTPGTVLPDTEDLDLLPVFGSLEAGDGAAERKTERRSTADMAEGGSSCIIS